MSEQKELKVEDIIKAAEEKACVVDKALYYVSEFLSGPMCGKCFPCSFGSYEAKIRLKRITDGTGTDDDLAAVKKIADNMLEASMCKKGKDTAKFIIEWIDSDVFAKHIEGICPEKTCLALVEYRIIPDKCTNCGECRDVCMYGAIHGEKKKPFRSGYHPFEIRQKKCTKCDECIRVCPEGAIVLVNSRAIEPVEV